ncbi:MAG: FecR family protein [Rhizobium sp.]|nr:MAG: FecR family protein [Rhizobium sp.]
MDAKDPDREDEHFAEANRWFFRLQAEDVSTAEKQQFSRWLHEDTAHAEAWRDVHALMRSLHAPAQASYNARQAARLWAFDKRRFVARRRTSRRSRTIPALGASCLFFIVAFGAYVHGPAWYDRWVADYSTVSGQRETITLADGTRVDLNTDTALNIAVTAGSRRVTVLRGEAFFEIAKDPRPFIVVTRDAESRDIGTAFSVEKSDDNSTVTVQTGIVDVGASIDPDTTVRVTAGEMVDCGAGGLSVLRKADLERQLAWRRGQLIFRQERLSDVVAALNRYRTGRIIIVNPWIGNELVSGTFDIDNPKAPIDALEAVLGVKATYLTSYVVALR